MKRYRYTSVILVLVLLIVSCEKAEKEAQPPQVIPDGESAHTATIGRDEALVKTWEEFEKDGWYAQFPSAPETKYEDRPIQGGSMKLATTAAIHPETGAEFSIRVATHAPESPLVRDTKSALDFHQAWLLSEIDGELESGEKTQFSGIPARDIRLTVKGNGATSKVAFARIVPVGARVYQVVVVSERDANNPVAGFIESFGVQQNSQDKLGWKMVSPPDCFCKFWVPTPPVTQPVDVSVLGDTRVSGKQYLQSSPNSGVAYTVTTAMVGDVFLMDLDKAKLFKRLADSVATRVNGKVVATVPVTHDGQIGMEAAIKPTDGPGVVRARVFSANQRVYILEAAVLNPVDVTSPEVERFFVDFQFGPAN